MPHLTVDYSANVEDAVEGLCDVIRQAAIRTGVFPMPGIRVRAFRADQVSIADGGDRHGYVDISIRLRAGRTDQQKELAASAVFEAARVHLAPAMATRSIALSLELRDIDPDLSPKAGTIRDHL